jgi:hypothetical protein
LRSISRCRIALREVPAMGACSGAFARKGTTMTRAYEMCRRAHVVRIEGASVFLALLALALMAFSPSAFAGESGAVAGIEVGSQALDLENLQAETDGGVIRAVPLPGALVGAVNERLFIAVLIGEPEGYGEQRQVTVYVCDSDQVSIWVRGAMEGTGATLVSDHIRVALVVDGGTASGYVVLAEGQDQPFEAAVASGDAGLYRAEEALGDLIAIGSWIVLHDGRQRGIIVLHEDDEQQDITYLLQ